ncbi:MAG: hypothetical protein R3D68_01480 [Hyphomicrobiaceae bacterium]
MKLVRLATASLALAGLLAMGAAPASAGCVDKGGRGWGSAKQDARFQAWEAVLQATDWGMWAAWMSSGAKVGKAAAGYKVSNVREKCGKDGNSAVCVIRAKLCK